MLLTLPTEVALEQVHDNHNHSMTPWLTGLTTQVPLYMFLIRAKFGKLIAKFLFVLAKFLNSSSFVLDGILEASIVELQGLVFHL